MSQLRHVSYETSSERRYLLIFDLKGGSTAGRRRINRYLEHHARMIQKSVWEFNDFHELRDAAKLVKKLGRELVAFKKSDAIYFNECLI